MSQIGTIGSATFAQSLTGIEEMLTELPDNTGNEINAQKVRNVVYTLYEEIQGNSASEFFYTNSKGLNNPVGNWTMGKSFSNVSLQDLFNGIFYKDVAGSAGLEFDPTQSTLEFKQPNTAGYQFSNTGYDELTSFKLKWTASKGTYDLIGLSGRIERDPAPIVGTEVPQSGDPLFSIDVTSQGGTDRTPIIKPRINVTNTYTFKFRDINNQPYEKSISIGYGNKQYIGVINSRAIPSDDDIRKLALSSIVSPTINNSGQTKSGGFLSLKGTISGHGGGGGYLIIVTTETLSFEFFNAPWFEYDLIGVKSYTNIYGYATNYNVYISKSTYGSAVGNYTIK